MAPCYPWLRRTCWQCTACRSCPSFTTRSVGTQGYQTMQWHAQPCHHVLFVCLCDPLPPPVVSACDAWLQWRQEGDGKTALVSSSAQVPYACAQLCSCTTTARCLSVHCPPVTLRLAQDGHFGSISQRLTSIVESGQGSDDVTTPESLFAALVKDDLPCTATRLLYIEPSVYDAVNKMAKTDGLKMSGVCPSSSA